LDAGLRLPTRNPCNGRGINDRCREAVRCGVVTCRQRAQTQSTNVCAAKNAKEAKRIILTASGGPFRTLAREDFERITVKDALKHPTWQMGPKQTAAARFSQP